MSSSTPARGRRAALTPSRRPDAVTVVAVLLPVLTLGGVLLVTPSDQPPAPRPPSAGQVERVDRVCPAAIGSGPVAVVSAEGEDGRARLLELVEGGPPPQGVRLRDSVVASESVAGPVLLSVEGEPAAGLVAGRSEAEPVAAVTCPQPGAEAWFTGVGARLDHQSVVEVDNPDSGTAVVDLTLLSGRGVLEAPDLRGISVPGHGSVAVDLAGTLPRRGTLAVHAVVSRGRAAVTVVDRVGLREVEQRREWMTGQPAPVEQSVLLGLPADAVDQRLVLANPGDGDAVATVEVVTATSTFAPADLDEVRLPPGSVRSVPLDTILAGKVARGALGVQVEASGPVTASLRSTVDDDLALTPVALPIEYRGAALVPPLSSRGTATLVLGGVSAAGPVQVTAFDVQGEAVLDERVDLEAGQGERLSLPEGVTFVRVTPTEVTVSAAVVVTDRTGAAVVSFVDLPQRSLTPYVGPAPR